MPILDIENRIQPINQNTVFFFNKLNQNMIDCVDVMFVQRTFKTSQWPVKCENMYNLSNNFMNHLRWLLAFFRTLHMDVSRMNVHFCFWIIFITLFSYRYNISGDSIISGCLLLLWIVKCKKNFHRIRRKRDST